MLSEHTSVNSEGEQHFENIKFEPRMEANIGEQRQGNCWRIFEFKNESETQPTMRNVGEPWLRV